MAVIITVGFRCLNGDEERVIKVLDPWPARWTMEVRAAIATLLMFATLGEENYLKRLSAPGEARRRQEL